MLGFDFLVEYKAGSTNTVVDALSCCDTEEEVVLTISGPRFDFINRFRRPLIRTQRWLRLTQKSPPISA
jgi:hypothetical protein